MHLCWPSLAAAAAIADASDATASVGVAIVGFGFANVVADDATGPNPACECSMNLVSHLCGFLILRIMC